MRGSFGGIALQEGMPAGAEAPPSSLAASAPAAAGFRGQSAPRPPGADARGAWLQEIEKRSRKICLPRLPICSMQQILTEHLLCAGP